MLVLSSSSDTRSGDVIEKRPVLVGVGSNADDVLAVLLGVRV
jgi:hypothetical protein